ncbi:hypothetical protein BDR05DRAFT_621636 [Suillus weaverae]|nr:hypothetical protein BDR05DRAFT_621636 [Suillus weaverae]
MAGNFFNLSYIFLKANIRMVNKFSEGRVFVAGVSTVHWVVRCGWSDWCYEQGLDFQVYKMLHARHN